MSYNIKKAAVLGAGVMGSTIAAHIAGAGIPVILMDMPVTKLSDTETQKGLTLENPLVRNRIAIEAKNNVVNPKARSIYSPEFANLIEVGNFEDHMHRLSECDWVVEVIIENLEIKKNLMKKIEMNTRPGTIITTNTSGLPVNSIVEDMPLEFRQTFLGTHFFNPPRYMKLFEMIPGKDTKPELIRFMKEFGEMRLGKGVVMAKDTPGFIANRIGTYALIKTMVATQKYGYSVAKVDKLTGTIIFRPKSATYRTLDMVGIDIIKHVTENTANAVTDPAEKAVFVVPEFVYHMIDNKLLGDKTKQGFYKKDGKERFMYDYKTLSYVPADEAKIEALEAVGKSKTALTDLIYGDSEEGKFIWEQLRDTLVYCAKLVPEIADYYQSIDEGMIWGYNWSQGPFEIWDVIGVEKSVEKMKAEGVEVPAWVLKKIDKGETKFYPVPRRSSNHISLADDFKVITENSGAKLIDLGDEVLCLTFKTKGNTVTDDVTDMLMAAADIVEKEYKGLVIAGAGPNFSLGANLGIIKGFMDEKAWDKVEASVNKLQTATNRIKYCGKPVVAAIQGMVFGGGAEIALHTDKIVAHAETYMGLVEAGVGLVPGGGGNKEMLLRSIENAGNVAPKESIPQFKKAWETIAMGKVSSSAFDAFNLGFLRKTDEVVMNSNYLLQAAKDEVLNMYKKGYRVPIKKEISVLGNDGKAMIQYTTSFMELGDFISSYDAHVANTAAAIMTGGDIPVNSKVTEEHLLYIERQAFVDLCKQEKTQQRVEYMLNTNKPLKN